MERGVRKGIDTLIDIPRVRGLDQIKLDENDQIHIGPLVMHGECEASKIIIEQAFPLARACREVGAPQIRNRGTIAGNLITASPANDTITPLLALGAKVRLRSTSAERVISLEDFYQGVRLTVMHPDEMMVDIFFPAMAVNHRGIFLKFGLRRAQAISLVDVALLLTFTSVDQSALTSHVVGKAVITLGAVAPTIIHAEEA